MLLGTRNIVPKHQIKFSLKDHRSAIMTINIAICLSLGSRVHQIIHLYLKDSPTLVTVMGSPMHRKPTHPTGGVHHRVFQL